MRKRERLMHVGGSERGWFEALSCPSGPTARPSAIRRYPALRILACSSVTTYQDFIGGRTFVQKLKESAREAAVCALSTSKSLSRNKGCIRFPFYHHVFDDERRGFERQLDVMKQHGDFLCMDDAIRLLEDGRQIDGCYFCLSFDDGLRTP